MIESGDRIAIPQQVYRQREQSARQLRVYDLLKRALNLYQGAPLSPGDDQAGQSSTRSGLDST
jgi:hypothetical protein